MKIAKIIFALLSLAALVGGGIMLWPEEQIDNKFRFDKVTIGNISQAVTANGTLNPIEIANVGTQVSGTVQKLYAEVNDEVKKGQLLAQIDPQLLESSLKQTKSSLEIARINYDQAGRDLNRAKELYNKDYIARVEVERAQQSFMSAKLSYESSQAQVERSEIELNYSKVTSPIDGVVISKEVTEGQTVASSFQAPTLFRIAGSLVDMKIDVTLPESDIGMVKKGMGVTFTVDAYPDKIFEGVLDSINLNPNTGQLVVTYSATVLLKNKDKLLLPGMTAYVNITVQERKNVMRVPAAAFRFKPPAQKQSGFKALFDPSSRYRGRSNPAINNEPGIFVLRDNKLVEIKATPGMMDDNFVEVSSEELKEGDVVAVGIARQEG